MANLTIRSNCTNIWSALKKKKKRKYDTGERQHKATDQEISYYMQIHASFSQVNSPFNGILIAMLNV